MAITASNYKAVSWKIDLKHLLYVFIYSFFYYYIYIFIILLPFALDTLFFALYIDLSLWHEKKIRLHFIIDGSQYYYFENGKYKCRFTYTHPNKFDRKNHIINVNVYNSDIF